MIAIAFAAAVASAILWSVVNVLDDVLKKNVYLNAFDGVIISAMFGSLTIGAILFVPIAAPSLLTVGLGILVAVSASFGFLLYFKSFDIETPSTVVALWNLVPVYLLFISQLLGEHISMLGYLASIAIVVGSFTLTFDFSKFKLSKAYGLMALSSLFLAVSAIAEFYLLQQINFASSIFYVGIGNVVCVLFFATAFAGGREVAKHSVAQWKKYWWIFVVSEAINLAAVMFNSYAISQGVVTLVKVVEASQAAMVMAISLVLHPWLPKYMRETWQMLTPKKVLSFVAIIAGLIVLNIA